jgi:predicted metalloprotease with PDZ domain
MKVKTRALLLDLVLFLLVFCCLAPAAETRMSFTVSMEDPHTHYYHVVLRCQGFTGETQNLKLPVWTPGYYLIMDYAKNVLNFKAEDGAGNPLDWAKTTKNTWQVKSRDADPLIIKYDVYAFSRSVADSYLDDARAFICPTGLFMHVEGHLDQPVSVTFHPHDPNHIISTGLDPVLGEPDTFSAPDFDILYDCPVLIGNQEILSFDIQGIPHKIAIENLGNFDREKFTADIKKVCESAVSLIGEIPYSHYTFIMMESGGGGLEHSNSMAVFYSPSAWEDPAGYKRWLAFIAHEYYHLYNVKRIRPIALGPFDYDRENYTNMLWVSEGFSVYYEYLILRRAGFLTREEFFDRVQGFISAYENRPGRLFQSVQESSFDTWLKFFNRSDNSTNTTISYYDKGAALGLLLDLKIRHETDNHLSLDDVMRTLYYDYYKKMKRGFTDAEFRAECERAAGCSLPEIFDVFVPTVQDIDYVKYFAYAGLEIDTSYQELPDVFFGASTREQDGRLLVTSVEWDSPAWKGGLSARDDILSVDGKKASSQSLQDTLDFKRPGDSLRMVVSRRGQKREIEVILTKKRERSFRIKPLSDPDALQLKIRDDWLRRGHPQPRP